MGGCWALADVDKKFKQENLLQHKSWEDSASGVANIEVLLELMIMLEHKGRHVTEGEIKIGFDCKKGYEKTTKGMMK